MARSSNPAITFVTAHRARLETRISPQRIASLALAGTIRARILPGQTPRYCLEDLLRLKQEESPRHEAAGKDGVQ
jgi:hypothetical protein